LAARRFIRLASKVNTESVTCVHSLRYVTLLSNMPFSGTDVEKGGQNMYKLFRPVYSPLALTPNVPNIGRFFKQDDKNCAMPLGRSTYIAIKDPCTQLLMLSFSSFVIMKF
jgi:hypothetical protein